MLLLILCQIRLNFKNMYVIYIIYRVGYECDELFEMFLIKTWKKNN